MTAAAYAPVVRDGFIWDDETYIEKNPTLRSMQGLGRIWVEPSSNKQYYPLVLTTFWIEYQLWELAPRGYHIVNVVLHAACVLLLWRLLVRLNVPGAWLAAAIFAVHPVMVESVAWVTERKNVLSLALTLASMHCYLRFEPAESGTRAAPARPWRWYVAALLLFTAALLSKTVVLSMPAVLMVIYWWKRGRLFLYDLALLLPFFAIGTGLGLNTVRMERDTVHAVGRDWDLSPVERVLIAGRAVWFYAGKLVWPCPLVFWYPKWHVDAGMWWQYLFPAAALGVILALWFARRRIGRGALAAVLIFAGVLVPALGFFNVFPFRFSYVADHFQYHASIALVTLAAAGAALVAARLPRDARIASQVAAAFLLVGLAALTFRQTFIYEGLEPLYYDVIAKNPNPWMAYGNLAVHYEAQNRHDDAYPLFKKAVDLFPDDATQQSNMGHILLKLGERDGFKPGQVDEMIHRFTRAVELDPQSVPARRGLGFALYHAKRYDESIEQFARTLDVQKNELEALVGMGAVQGAAGRYAEAEQFFKRALGIAPAYAEAHRSLGMLHTAQGRIDEAIRDLREAVRLQPNHAQAHYELGELLEQKKDFRAAEEHFLQATRFQPGYADPWNGLGSVYGSTGHIDRAIECFEHALRLNRDYAAARANLEQARALREQQATPK